MHTWSISCTGIDPCRDSPADSPDAIVVGTTNRNDSIFYRLFYGRNYEDCVTLFAPGLYIRSATISKRYDEDVIMCTYTVSTCIFMLN